MDMSMMGEPNWRGQIVESEMSELKRLSFISCDCTIITIQKLEKLESLNFRSDCLIPIRVMEEISNSFENLVELRFPNIPSGFIPLVIRNHPRIQGNLFKIKKMRNGVEEFQSNWILFYSKFNEFFSTST